MPNKTYIQGIPDGPNNPSTDQPDMKTNTDSIYDILGGDSTVDMIGFGDNDGGWHRHITYVNQASDPGSAATQYRVYSKQSGGQSELFAQKDGTATPIQLTKKVPVASTNGYSYLPGGLLIQWVQRTATGAFSWPVAFTSAVYGATIGYNDAVSGTVPNLTSLTTSGAVLNNSSTATVFIMAVGT